MICVVIVWLFVCLSACLPVCLFCLLANKRVHNNNNNNNNNNNTRIMFMVLSS